MADRFPAAQVDCYMIDGKVYFGEVMFFTMGGLIRFIPDEWGFNLGEKLILPARRE